MIKVFRKYRLTSWYIFSAALLDGPSSSIQMVEVNLKWCSSTPNSFKAWLGSMIWSLYGWKNHTLHIVLYHKGTGKYFHWIKEYIILSCKIVDSDRLRDI